MAYCTKCGRKLVEGARFCDKCGAPVCQEYNTYQNNIKVRTNYGMISIILSFIFSLLGLIFAIIGLKKGDELDRKNAKFGLGMSIIFLIVHVAFIVIYGIYFFNKYYIII